MTAEPRVSSVRKGQAGLTLIELMVALVIGLLIVLGATQLFIIGKQTFDQVQVLGIKQEAINFAADSLADDIRKAKLDGIEEKNDNSVLVVKFYDYYEEAYCPHDKSLLEKRYRLGESPEGSGDYSLSVRVECEDDDAGGYQPLASGFVKDGLSFEEISSGIWRVGLKVNGMSDEEINESREVKFQVMNRAEAIGADNLDDDDGEDDGEDD